MSRTGRLSKSPPTTGSAMDSDEVIEGYPEEFESEEFKIEDDAVIQCIEKGKEELKITSASKEELAAKCKCLRDVLHYLDIYAKLKKCPPDNIFAEIMEMICVNLFRRLPQKETPPCPDALMEDEAATEPLWDHLQVIYTILQRLVMLEGNNIVLRTHLNERFIQQLFELFHSEDLRERDKVKVALHRIYLKMTLHRPFIRKKICEVACGHMSGERCEGVNQVLQLYGCIVSGFSTPLREEHLRFLDKVLLPLHKMDDLPSYHKFLTYCIVQFLYLDENLTSSVFASLLQYWPNRNLQNEVLFLKEIEDYLQVILPHQFNLISESLFRQISKSMTSLNFQVAQKACTLWQNQRALTMFVMNHENLMPIVLPGLYMLRRAHWSQTITNLIYGVFKSFMLMNRGLFNELVDVCKSTIKKLESELREKQGHKVRFKDDLNEVDEENLSDEETV